MKNALYLCLAGAFFATASCHDNRKAKNYNEKTKVDDQALAFVQKANEAGLTEIKAANIAQTKSTNTKVVGFAKMMITDHMAAGKELKDIAASKYVTVNNMLSPKHEDAISEISKLSGPAFDKAYINMMIEDHKKTVELFHDASQNTSSTIRKYTNKELPKLKMHLESAKSIAASL